MPKPHTHTIFSYIKHYKIKMCNKNVEIYFFFKKIKNHHFIGVKLL